MPETPSIYPAGDNSLTICLGKRIDFAVSQQVFQLYHHLLQQKNSFWLELIPAYASLTVVYDAELIRRHYPSAQHWVTTTLENALREFRDELMPESRLLHIPVCYDSSFGLDLISLSKAKKRSADQIIEIHCNQTYRVFMLGFLPGFAYMGIVDDAIAAPRLSTPRKHVPAGSVGIAGHQTGIYPLDSPGGWNIIGRTPVRIFNPRVCTDTDTGSVHTDIVFFQPGDEVKFYAITREEYDAFDEQQFNPFSV